MCFYEVCKHVRGMLTCALRVESISECILSFSDDDFQLGPWVFLHVVPQGKEDTYESRRVPPIQEQSIIPEPGPDFFIKVSFIRIFFL